MQWLYPEKRALLDKVPFKSTANQHSWKKKSSCSHSYSQLPFCTLLAQHFVQLRSDQGKHPAERPSNFCFQLYPFSSSCSPYGYRNTYPVTKKWFVCRTDGLLLAFGCRHGLQFLLNHSLSTQLQNGK